MNKRGVSPVIATVLLLVLTIVIGGVIFSVVIPFVKDSLGNSKVCLEALESVEFAESKFNCYKQTAPYDTGFSIKLNKDGITGFRVALIDSNGNSDVKDIKPSPAQPPEGIRMVGGSNVAFSFPSVGGQRSYVANKQYSRAEISPIVQSGKICAVADVVEFTPCGTGVNL